MNNWPCLIWPEICRRAIKPKHNNITYSPAANKLHLDLWYIENVFTDYGRDHLGTSKSSGCQFVTLGQLAESNMASKRADIYQDPAIIGLYYAKIGFFWSWRVLNSYLYIILKYGCIFLEITMVGKTNGIQDGWQNYKMVFLSFIFSFFDTVKYLSGIKQFGRVKEHSYNLP